MPMFRDLDMRRPCIVRALASFDIFCVVLNCDSPLVGGYEPKKRAVAIRRIYKYKITGF